MKKETLEEEPNPFELPKALPDDVFYESLEEPKQETFEEVDEIEKIAMDKLKSKWEHLYTFGYPQKPFPTNYENDLNMVKIGLYEGAKWQAERSYSEEDMIDFALFLEIHLPMKPRKTHRQLLEQFKK